MGEEIGSRGFTEADHEEFRTRLRHETGILKRWFDERAFDVADGYSIGLELEAWLIDENHLPAPRNQEFLAAIGDPDIVEELSKFNFEINTPPRALGAFALSRTEADLEAVWAKCRATAETNDMATLAIGILPTVRDEMLRLDWMSDANRYHALNKELLWHRQQEPLHILIEGQDCLDYRCDNLMLEAACTSLQAHLKINQDDAVRFYNAGVLAAGPLVAATANSPFLYGKSLWAETRIPAFEQATTMHGFRDKAGRNTLRVTLGTGYLRQSFLEPFLQNLDFPSLLPALSDDTSKLPHLRMQNGTVWRWVRPILGFVGGVPHLRIEHRVIPAGPSLADTAANLALCHGLMLALAEAGRTPDEIAPFETARANFYACAKDGLHAEIGWAGRQVNVQSLLLEELLPAARDALAREGIESADLDRYFKEILTPRLMTGRTGAEWQRAYVDCHGPDFQALTARYHELQEAGDPVHEWTI